MKQSWKNWKEREAASKEGYPIDWKAWNPRMKRIYNLVAGEIAEKKIRTVLDLGAGQMYLKTLLPDDVKYFPVDYTARCADTIVCDFNEKQFPDLDADLIIAAGLLNFVHDVPWLLKTAFQHCRRKLIITETPIELEGDLEKRKQIYLWENHYSYAQYSRIIYDSGFVPTHIEKGNYNKRVEQTIFVLEKAAPDVLPRMSSCTGCGTCAALCPHDALQMAFDSEGFLRPDFDAVRCVGCGRCLNVCPAIHFESENDKEVESYAVWAPDEIRRKSSSGGAFALIAEEILRQGGAVFGARYDPEKKAVEHTVIRSSEELSSLHGSKYVQSDIGGVYDAVRALLEKGDTPVLFSGTPCQVAGLYAALGKSIENLYTVDLICAGVTSPQMFRRYLGENYDLEQVRNVNCRTKEHGWDPFYITVEFSDGSSQTTHRNQDPFEKLFHSFLGMRECCYQCNFAPFPRQADITLGDFWGVQNFNPDLDDGKGTSFVCVNNDKGRKLMTAVQRTAALVEPVPWEYTKTNRLSPFLAERAKLPAARDYFYHLLKTRSYREAAERATGERYDVGVVCNWSGENYGAQLTQYAFYRVLTNMGLEPVMIERPSMPFPGGNATDAGLFRENPYPSYAMHPLFNNLDELRAINDLADTFIVPSDQLWNALFAEKDLLALGYIANNKKKIAYATSFGCDPCNWSEDERAREAFFLQQIDSISVREDSGVTILRERFGVENAEQTLDPVFLHETEFYDRLCRHSKYLKKSGHLTAFILDPDETKAGWIKALRGRLGVESIQICDVNTFADGASRWSLSAEQNIRVEDLLAAVKSSSFVLTDSFHGVCMALLFRKPFLAWGNRKRGLTRFLSLLDQLNLKERLVESANISDDLLFREIDYAAVGKILSRERERSLQWLKNALEKPKRAALTAYDILDREQVQARRQMAELRERTDDFEAGISQSIDAINTELLKHAHGIDAINAELLRNAGRMGAVNTELLKHAHGIDAVNAELLRNAGRMDAVNAELLKHAHGIDAINAELLRNAGRVDAVNAELLKHAHGIDAINAELLKHARGIDAVNAELLRNAGRMDAINAELLRINQNIDRQNVELLQRDQRIECLEERLTWLEKSFSYRIRRALMRLPRRIIGVFRRKKGG